MIFNCCFFISYRPPPEHHSLLLSSPLLSLLFLSSPLLSSPLPSSPLLSSPSSSSPLLSSPLLSSPLLSSPLIPPSGLIQSILWGDCIGEKDVAEANKRIITTGSKPSCKSVPSGHGGCCMKQRKSKTQTDRAMCREGRKGSKARRRRRRKAESWTRTSRSGSPSARAAVWLMLWDSHSSDADHTHTVLCAFHHTAASGLLHNSERPRCLLYPQLNTSHVSLLVLCLMESWKQEKTKETRRPLRHSEYAAMPNLHQLMLVHWVYSHVCFIDSARDGWAVSQLHIFLFSSAFC